MLLGDDMADTIDTVKNEVVRTKEERLGVRDLKDAIDQLDSQEEFQQALLNGIKFKKQELRDLLKQLKS